MVGKVRTAFKMLNRVWSSNIQDRNKSKDFELQHETSTAVQGLTAQPREHQSNWSIKFKDL